VKKWFFVEVSFMKLALLKSPMNRTATILGFFTSLLGGKDEQEGIGRRGKWEGRNN